MSHNLPEWISSRATAGLAIPFLAFAGQSAIALFVAFAQTIPAKRERFGVKSRFARKASSAHCQVDHQLECAVLVESAKKEKNMRNMAWTNGIFKHPGLWPRPSSIRLAPNTSSFGCPVVVIGCELFCLEWSIGGGKVAVGSC